MGNSEAIWMNVINQIDQIFEGQHPPSYSHDSSSNSVNIDSSVRNYASDLSADKSSSVLIENSESKFNEEINEKTEEKPGDRAERKRCREKQRRLDVNYQFSELTILLQKIDAEDDSDGENPSKRFKFSSGSPMNRIDLVSKTISVMSHIHSENLKMKSTISELKTEISSLKKKASEIEESNPKKPGQMMMMVPMMMPNGSQAPFMSQGMPFCSMMPSAMNPFISNQASNASLAVDGASNPPASGNVTVAAPTSLIGTGENLAHCA